jgi:hypothetical protein
MELGNLDWCYAMGQPACPPEADALVTPRLVDEDKVVRLILCQVVQVKVLAGPRSALSQSAGLRSSTTPPLSMFC